MAGEENVMSKGNRAKKEMDKLYGQIGTYRKYLDKLVSECKDWLAGNSDDRYFAFEIEKTIKAIDADKNVQQ